MAKTKIQFLLKPHVINLFSAAVKSRKRSLLKEKITSYEEPPPEPDGYRIIGAHNSVGVALGYGHPNPLKVTSLSLMLRELISEASAATKFKFTYQEVDHVCDADPMAALLFTTAPSGYVRQYALSKISHLGPEIGLSLIILRLNDWVSEVREEAVETINRLIETKGGIRKSLAHPIASSLGLLLDSKRFERITEKERVAVDRLLTYDGVDEATLWQLSDPNFGQFGLRTLLIGMRSGYFDEFLPMLATTCQQPSVRSVAVRAILSGKFFWREASELRSRQISNAGARDSILDAALDDASPMIAAAALDHIIEKQDLDRVDISQLVKLLSNERFSVAERANYIIRKLGKSASEELRKADEDTISDDQRCFALARFGEGGDANLVMSLSRRSQGIVKINRLSAAAKLGHAPALSQIKVAATNYSADKMTRTALRALADLGEYLSLEEIETCMQNSQRKVTAADLSRHIKHLSAQEIAVTIAKASARGDHEDDLIRLLMTMRRKRSVGAFQPDQRLTEKILSYTASDPELQAQLLGELGISRAA